MTSSPENLGEGESNPCEVPMDYGAWQEHEGSAVKSPQPRFHWSENPGESQVPSSRRRSESMKKHGWMPQDGQTIDKGKPVAVPPEPRPLRFQRSRRRRRRRQKWAVASSDLHIMQENWGPHDDESMWWQQWWLQIHGTTREDWPEGMHLWEGKMYQ